MDETVRTDVRNAAIEAIEKIPRIRDNVYPVSILPAGKVFYKKCERRGYGLARDYNVFFAVDMGSEMDAGTIKHLGDAIRKSLNKLYPIETI